MKKNQFVLKKMKQVATCALALTIVATSTPSGIAYASNVSGTEDSKELVVEEIEDTTEDIEVTTEEESKTSKVNATTEQDLTSQEEQGVTGDNTSDEEVNALIENQVITTQEEVTPNSLGSTETQLEAGTYLVPVALMNASNINNPSMASSTLESLGIIKVSEDGTITLQTKWKSLTMGSIEGSVVKMSAFQTEDTSSEEAIAGLVESTVDTYREVSYSEELKPEKITLTIPNDRKTKNGVYIKMEVDMGMNPEAFIAIDYANANVVTLSLDKESLQLKVGESSTITATLPASTMDPAASFTSTDEGVVTVDENGTVNAIAVGNATITATANGITATCDIKVTSVAGYSFGSEGTKLETGTYLVPVSMKKATNINTESYAASAIEGVGVLKVSDNGSATLQTIWKVLYVYFVGSIPGNASKISAYQSNDIKTAELLEATIDSTRTIAGNTYPDKVTFTIPESMINTDGVYINMVTTAGTFDAYLAIDYVNRNQIALEATTIAIEKGMTQTIAPVFQDLESHNVTYISGNDSVATVDSSGKVTAVADGETTITVTDSDTGASTICAIYVVDKTTLKANIAEAEEINNVVGKYTTVSLQNLNAILGYAQITNEATNATQSVIDIWAAGLRSSINNMVEISTKLSVTNANIYIDSVNHTYQLSATTTGDDKTITWESDQTEIATVSETGLVTGLTEGTATITATANGKSEACTVTVKKTPANGYGSNVTELSKGSYLVNVELKNANDTTAASSAAKALKFVGTLAVDEEGNATLTTKWIPISFGSIAASIQTLDVYATTKAPQSDDTGSEFIVDSNGYASFEIPSIVKNQDGIYVRLSGQGMPIKPYAYISIDYKGASDISFVEKSYTVVKGEDKVLDVELLNEATATFSRTGSYLNIKSSDSNSVTITGTRVGTSTVTATSSVSGTKVTVSVTVVDKAALNNGISAAKSILEDVEGIYTTSSKKNLSAAITAAEVVKNNENATQTEINAQVSALLTARSNLIKNSITLDKTNETLYLNSSNSTVQILATVVGDSDSVVWTTDNEAVATVSESGLVSAVGAGTATITATANGISATFVVTVEGRTVVTVDKAALNNILSSAKAFKNTNGIYLATSFTTLTNIITAAQIVYNDENATQSEVDAKVKDLTNAIQALQKSSISLNQKTATIYTKIGTTTATFVATVVGDSKNVSWTTSNSAIAKVDAKGLVTAVSEGTVTITANANGVSASAIVTVKSPSLSLAETSGIVAVGGKITIDAVSDPTGNITYKTSNKKIATVTSKGVVKGIKKGTAKITVTSNGISKTFKVTVKAQTLKLKKSSGTVMTGKTITINATASPTGTITYKSSNKKIATVTSKGVIKGVKAGTATITVKCNGVSKTFKVTVNKQTLTLKKSSAAVKVGKTVKINAVASPKGKITYTSNNEEIATVTSKGVVKGIKKGTAKITVTCNGVSKIFKVTVK